MLPFSPLAHVLGFTTLPLSFFLILLGMIVTYLALVEFAKTRFYAREARPRAAPLTHEAAARTTGAPARGALRVPHEYPQRGAHAGGASR